MTLDDVSDEGSPVRVSGTISLQDESSQKMRYTYRTEGELQNLSNKDVLLTVIDFEASGVNAHKLHHTYLVDRFFSSGALQPGKTERIMSSSISLGIPLINGQPVPEEIDPEEVPAATAEVLFVQFADGSTWGDPEEGSRSLSERRDALNELRRLEQVLNEHGSDTFITEFGTSSASLRFTAINALESACERKPISCIVDGFRSMLKTATQNQARMNDSQDASASQ